MIKQEPGDFSNLTPSDREILKRQVSAFEAAWGSGTRPDLREYLLTPDPTGGRLLVELVRADLELRLQAGELARIDEYLLAHPELADRPGFARGVRAAASGPAEVAAHTVRDTFVAATDLFGGQAGAGDDSFELVSTPESSPLESYCVAFEQEWQAGLRPQIEDFLADTAEPDRTTLFSLLLDLELRLRRNAGEKPRLEEYSSRFPEYSDRLSVTDFGDQKGATVVYERPQKRLFAHFELLERLGGGGFGTVWKARDLNLGRIVALKIAHPHRQTDQGTTLFIREARAAAQLRHPNVVAIHDVRMEGGVPYIVYDFIEGVDLQQWLTGKQASPAQAAAWCAALARAVHHAHERGIIHRDLKPANVLVDRKGGWHITDFGLAKQENAEGVTRTGQVMGSLPYMSPEQAAGKSGTADARTDVYAIGTILYELLTGERPFRGGEAVLLHQILNDDPKPPRSVRKQVPRDLETICLKALQKSPGRRYASAAEFADDLERHLRGEPIVARRVSRLERGWKWVRRRPVLMMAAPPAFITGAALLAIPFGPPADARLITIETDPPGAEMRFVPHDPVTGELMPEEMIDPGPSPVIRCPLKPGDYLVVAALDGTRFHEVERHVPDFTEQAPNMHIHRRWGRKEDGSIALPKIEIPPATVADGMAKVEGADSFTLGIPGTDTLPPHRRKVPDFLIDGTEFTVGDFKVIYADSPPLKEIIRRGNDDQPLWADYDEAQTLAEYAGKRLPTEAEYEFAATGRGTQKAPWGEPPPPVFVLSSAGFPADDRIDFDRPVYGLRSNVAEWTSSWAVLYPTVRTGGVRTLPGLVPSQHRVVRGMPQPVDAGGELQPIDPRQRQLKHRQAQQNIGFRGVRSAKPRLNPEDFEVSLETQVTPKPVRGRP